MVLRIEALTYRYNSKTTALEDVSFSMQPGEFCALIGPNGSGKSTLCNMLQGELSASGNSEIQINGFNLGSVEARKALGYCAGNEYLPLFLTGQEYIRYVTSLAGKNLKDLDFQVKKFFKYLGMADRAGSLMETYSHGMLKKTQLIAALLSDPQLIIVDETLNGVDIESQLKLESLLKDFCRSGGAVLMCSHDFSMLARCVSRVLLLDFGLLLKDVSVEQLAEQAVTIEELILSYLEVDSRDPKPLQDG